MSALSRQDEEWPTLEQIGNTRIPPKPDGPIQVYIIIARPPRPLPPPVHHTQGAKTVAGPFQHEVER